MRAFCPLPSRAAVLSHGYVHKANSSANYSLTLSSSQNPRTPSFPLRMLLQATCIAVYAASLAAAIVPGAHHRRHVPSSPHESDSISVVPKSASDIGPSFRDDFPRNRPPPLFYPRDPERHPDQSTSLKPDLDNTHGVNVKESGIPTEIEAAIGTPHRPWRPSNGGPHPARPTRPTLSARQPRHTSTKWDGFPLPAATTASIGLVLETIHSIAAPKSAVRDPKHHKLPECDHPRAPTTSVTTSTATVPNDYSFDDEPISSKSIECTLYSYCADHPCPTLQSHAKRGESAETARHPISTIPDQIHVKQSPDMHGKDHRDYVAKQNGWSSAAHQAFTTCWHRPKECLKVVFHRYRHHSVDVPSNSTGNSSYISWLPATNRSR